MFKKINDKNFTPYSILTKNRNQMRLVPITIRDMMTVYTKANSLILDTQYGIFLEQNGHF
jgi:hypothetical protein